jgi:hypothetical protein
MRNVGVILHKNQLKELTNAGEAKVDEWINNTYLGY